MLDLQLIRDEPERVRRALRDKGAGDPAVVDRLLEADARRRAALADLQSLQQRVNEASRQVGELMRGGRQREAEPLKESTAALKTNLESAKEAAHSAEAEVDALVLEIPNIPHASVPVGSTSDDNEVVFEWGERPAFPGSSAEQAFEPLPHWDLAKRHGLVDFEAGVRVTGAGFPFYVGAGARLQRALIQFFLDSAAEAGYVEIQPPLLVNEASGIGTGQIPDKEGQMYQTEFVSEEFLAGIEDRVTKTEASIEATQAKLQVLFEASLRGRLNEQQLHYFELSRSQLADAVRHNVDARNSLAQARSLNKVYLVPTAEVPVTNYHRDDVLDESRLPILYAAYTPCFRREAGSYGKDVRGLNRLHQFDKVELVRFTTPDTSYEHLEALREDAERLLQALGLPYRRLLMCTGDMGFTQAKKYDLEVWSAGQQRWLEVSSISNFEAFQARRANIRFRRPIGGGKPEFVHTLNGSALALPRVMAALLENNQREDGTIEVPEVLRRYTGFGEVGSRK